MNYLKSIINESQFPSEDYVEDYNIKKITILHVWVSPATKSFRHVQVGDLLVGAILEDGTPVTLAEKKSWDEKAPDDWKEILDGTKKIRKGGKIFYTPVPEWFFRKNGLVAGQIVPEPWDKSIKETTMIKKFQDFCNEAKKYDKKI